MMKASKVTESALDLLSTSRSGIPSCHLCREFSRWCKSVFFFVFFFQFLDEHSKELSGDGSTTALYIFNFGSRAPNAFVAAFYF